MSPRLNANALAEIVDDAVRSRDIGTFDCDGTPVTVIGTEFANQNSRWNTWDAVIEVGGSLYIVVAEIRSDDSGEDPLVYIDSEGYARLVPYIQPSNLDRVKVSIMRDLATLTHAEATEIVGLVCGIVDARGGQ